MKRIARLVQNLPQYRWTYRFASISFWTLIVSVAMSATFLLFAHGSSGQYCEAHLEHDEISLGFPGVALTCSGFPYAKVVGSTLSLFMNLTIILGVCLIWGVISIIQLIQFGGWVVWVESIPILLILTGLTIPLLALHLLALLHIAHLCTRFRNDLRKKKS